MLDLPRRIDEAAAELRRIWPVRPQAGIILGTGLGGLAEEIDADATIDYADIPHFPCTTAMGHAGRLVCGRLCGVPVMAMEGRCHLYEGHSPATVTLPVRVMKELGAELLIASNASGGVNPAYRTGDVLVIADHVNMMFQNPLAGTPHERMGTRWPDVSRAYDAELIELALEIARRENFIAHRGVYVGVLGPNYETRAEYRWFRQLGDAVGMSTVPEVLVAAQCQLRVLALSTVTNVCKPDALGSVTGEQVIAAGKNAEPNVRKIVRGVLRAMGNNTDESERAEDQVISEEIAGARRTPGNSRKIKKSTSFH